MNIFSDNDCPQSALSAFISRLPVESRHIYQQKLPSYSSLYYDVKLACYFNHTIQMTYRCNLSSKRWIYVYGITNRFRQCYPSCTNHERDALLNKYFTRDQQRQIRTRYVRQDKSLRLKCFNQNENRWKVIKYKCNSMTITKYQWFKLHSCFEPRRIQKLPSKFI